MASSKGLVVDIDGTLCPLKRSGESYADLPAIVAMVERLRAWQAQGFRILLSTSRNMRTYGGNPGLIAKHTAPELMEWLVRHEVPFDELHLAKPWPGETGFYVDDRAVRPAEFLAHDLAGLQALVARDAPPQERGA